MAYSLSSGRPTLAAASTNPIRALFAWLGSMRAKRAQRMALATLLDLDGALLDDIGIDRSDIVEAMRYPSEHVGLRLSARRARRSRDWLAHP